MATAIPEKCPRCNLPTKPSFSKCSFCGHEYNKPFVSPAVSARAETGPTHTPASALPKCPRCGLTGKHSRTTCEACGAPYAGDTALKAKSIIAPPSTVTTEAKKLPRCTRCDSYGDAASVKCKFCGKEFDELDFSGIGREKARKMAPKTTSDGPSSTPATALPRCTRCDSYGDAASVKCKFCGKEFNEDDFSGKGRDTKAKTPVVPSAGPTHTPASALPRCTRCDSFGDAASVKCKFCGKEFDSADFSGVGRDKAKAVAVRSTEGPTSTPIAALPVCSRCKLKGQLNSTKCAFCGFPYSETYVLGAQTTSPTMDSVSGTATFGTPSATASSGTSAPSKFCPDCGAKAEGGGKFCPDCGSDLTAV